MVLPVYLYGHPVIRKETEEIDASENMYETMYATEGIGLAAPQIGLSIRLIVIDVNPMAEYFPECADVKLTLINPVLEVLEDGSKETREEGCLSLPGIHEPVPRIEKIRLKWVSCTSGSTRIRPFGREGLYRPNLAHSQAIDKIEVDQYH